MGDSYLAGPLKKYEDNYYCMRSSNDNDLSEPMGVYSLGVVDLDTSIVPDVFGLRSFDPHFSDVAGQFQNALRVGAGCGGFSGELS